MMNPCPDCGGCRAVARIPCDIDYLSGGELISVHVPELIVIKCLACGEIYFTNTSHDQITEALAQKLHSRIV
jgi:hypothetical protein